MGALQPARAGGILGGDAPGISKNAAQTSGKIIFRFLSGQSLYHKVKIFKNLTWIDLEPLCFLPAVLFYALIMCKAILLYTRFFITEQNEVTKQGLLLSHEAKRYALLMRAEGLYKNGFFNLCLLF